MTQPDIIYSTWDRIPGIRRAHLVHAITDGVILTKCHPNAKRSHAMKAATSRIVSSLDDIPPKTLPCNACFKVSDLPWAVRLVTAAEPKPSRKRCSSVNGCGKKKLLSEFARHPSKKFGRDSICKECARERRKFYPERTDGKTFRVPDHIHAKVKELAEQKNLGVQELVVRLLAYGVKAMCQTRECKQQATHGLYCQKHHFEIVERKIA